MLLKSLAGLACHTACTCGLVAAARPVLNMLVLWVGWRRLVLVGSQLLSQLL
jgi:hypothetical protein